MVAPPFRRSVTYSMTHSDGRKGILIGTVSGRVTALVRTDGRWVETPTWSPTGHEIAYIVRGADTKCHNGAHLEGRLSQLVADGLPSRPIL